MNKHLSRAALVALPALLLILFHFLLFSLYTRNPGVFPISAERIAWQLLLSPYTLLALGCGTIIIAIIANKKSGHTISPIPSSKADYCILAYCCLSALLCNTYTLNFPEQLPLTTLFVAGCVYISIAICGKLCILCWFPLIFLSLISIAASFMKMELSCANLVELFGATWVDAKDYVTPANVMLLFGAILIAAVWPIPAYLCLRRLPRIKLGLNGVIYLCIALFLLQTSQNNISKSQYSLWPIGTSNHICYEVFKAKKIIGEMKTLLRTLPPKEAAMNAISCELSDEDEIICVLHVGESLRADHLTINGYQRDTTPRLAAMDGIISFTDCTAAAHLTDRAVMVMLTNARRDSITNSDNKYAASSPSLPDFFAASNKFDTASFWSEGSCKDDGGPLWIEEVKFFTRAVEHNVETSGLPLEQLSDVKDFISSHSGKNLFILLNNRGSHAPYDEFNTEDAHFPVSQKISYKLSPETYARDAQDVLNAYDNTVYELDKYIAELAAHMKGKPFLYIYMSDHGEFAGEMGYWYRAYSPQELFYRSHACQIGFLIYASPELLAKNTDFEKKYNTLFKHKDIRIGQEHLFHTILGFFGIKTPFYTESLDLTSENVQPYEGPHPDRNGNSADGTR